MGAITFLRDRLTNVMSGMGTTVDRGGASQYVFMPLSGAEAEAAYRTSWLARKIVDVPPKDMTRAWRNWQTSKDVIQKLEAEEKRLQLKAKCQRALVLSRLYGGGALILGTKDADPSQAIVPERLPKGGLTYVHVLSRHQLSEGPERRDPADPWFGHPEYFQLTTTARGSAIKLHPSRVVAFVGQKAPEGGFYSNASWFWGDPIMQSIGDAVKNADTSQAGFAALIDEAAVDIIGIPDLMAQVATPEYETRLMNRLSAAKLGASTWRMKIRDAAETWETKQITWAGIPDIMTAFLNVVAGAADIPVTRLLGQSPKGLQSTGDGEERDYHSKVKADQDELLAPALDRVDELLIRSALGSRPDDIYYSFAPLSEPDRKQAADIEKTKADTIKIYSDTGHLPDSALAEIAKNSIIEGGQWPGSEAAFEAAEIAGPDDDQDPDDEAAKADLRTRGENVIELKRRGAVNDSQAELLIADAAPRSLYVQRKLLNAAELIRWAKGQGFETTTPAADMHVTVLFSRTAVDWMKMGSDWSGDAKGNIIIPAGGARLVEPLGDKGAVVLLFSSSSLSWRHEEMVRNGASHDFDDYQPHVTITYERPDGLDLAKVEPFRGKLVFGPEIFSEIDDDWKVGLAEA